MLDDDGCRCGQERGHKLDDGWVANLGPSPSSTTQPTQTSPAFNHHAPQWMCCCSVWHVHNASKWIAIGGLVVKIFPLTASLLTGQWYGVALSLVGALSYTLILLARKWLRPSLLLPYLAINVLYIMASMASAVLTISAAVKARD